MRIEIKCEVWGRRKGIGRVEISMAYWEMEIYRLCLDRPF
jgi:hypothetical protein